MARADRISPGLPAAAIIKSLDDYERATARVAEPSAQAATESRDQVLKALTDAIMAWDRGHDDATSWS